MTNPWMALWLNGAAEMQRQHAHLVGEMMQRSLKLIGGASAMSESERPKPHLKLVEPMPRPAAAAVKPRKRTDLEKLLQV